MTNAAAQAVVTAWRTQQFGPFARPVATHAPSNAMCRDNEWKSSRRMHSPQPHPMQSSPQKTLRSILWLNSTHGRRKAEAVMLGAERVVACINDLEPDVQRLALEFVFDAFEDALLSRPSRRSAPGAS